MKKMLLLFVCLFVFMASVFLQNTNAGTQKTYDLTEYVIFDATKGYATEWTVLSASFVIDTTGYVSGLFVRSTSPVVENTGGMPAAHLEVEGAFWETPTDINWSDITHLFQSPNQQKPTSDKIEELGLYLCPADPMKALRVIRFRIRYKNITQFDSDMALTMNRFYELTFKKTGL